MFGSILGRWVIQTLGPVAPGSVVVGLLSWQESQAEPGFVVGHSHNLCVTLLSAHPIGMTDYRSKAIWLDWYPNPSTGSLASNAKSLSWNHSYRYLGDSLAPVISLTPKCLPFLVVFQYSPPSLPNMIAHILIPSSSLSTQESLLFPHSRQTWVSPHEPSCYLVCLHLHCRIIILYFTTNIYS